jgi:DUF1680 family protein
MTVDDRMHRIDPSEITVGGWIGERLERTWKHNLLVLDWDQDFLAPFQEHRSSGGYVGLGKTLEALVRFARHTAEPDLLNLREHVLKALFDSQQTDGYLGTMVPEHRIDTLWDVHETAYLILALVSDWRYFRNEDSLDRARAMGTYLTDRLTPERILSINADKNAIELKTIGLDRAMIALYQETGEEKFLDFTLRVQDLLHWDLGIVEGRHGKIEGHIYAYLTRCLAQLELYNLSEDPGLLGQTERALHYLKSEGGLVVTGSCGQTECWHSDQDGTGDLGETCATAYLIRLLDKRLRLSADLNEGNLMERAIYNALFAAQSPDGRPLRYYAPFSGPRIYWDRDTYCCPGNFRRIVSELPEMIVYKHGAGLSVNLYSPAKLNTEIASGQVDLRIETDYPASGFVSVLVNPESAAKFPLRLRIPAWCDQYDVLVNGQEIDTSDRDGHLLIDRTWQPGDTVSLDFQMDWRFHRGFGKQEGRVSVLRGPVLYCLNPERNPDLGEDDVGGLTLLADSPSLRIPEPATHPGETSCLLRALGSDSANDLTVTFTEFCDPGGLETYFPISDPDTAVDDELLTTTPESVL